MKAVVMTAQGGPDVLEVRDIPTPEMTAPDHVLVRLHAAGINPVDVKMRDGAYTMAELPHVLGWDGAGVVEAVGSEVTTVKPGDEIYTMYGSFGNPEAKGCYAEYLRLPERNVALKPTSLSFVEAAAVPLVLLTTWEAIFERAHLRAGQTILIHAGAGGVGHLAIQLAAAAGATVYTTVGSAEKAAWVKELGATEAILYKETDFVDAVMDLTNGKGVDIAYDIIGGPSVEPTARAVKFFGDLVTLVKPSDNINLAPMRMRNIRLGFEVVLAPLLHGLLDAQKGQTHILNAAAKMFDDGKLNVHVGQTLPLEQAADAHNLIEQGSTTGKIVLETA